MRLAKKKKDITSAELREVKPRTDRLGNVFLRALFWPVFFLGVALGLPLFLEWQGLSAQVERFETERLRQTARNIGRVLRPEWHTKLAEAYAASDPGISSLPELAELKRTLRSFQESEQIRGEISTFVQLADKSDSIAYLAMSSEKQYTGTSVPMPKEAREMWAKNVLTARATSEGAARSLTLFSPIVNPEGQVIGGVQIEHDLQRSLLAAEDRWVQERMVGWLPWILLALVGLFVSAFATSHPYAHLKRLIATAAKDGAHSLPADPSPKKGDTTIWNLRAIAQKAEEKTIVLKQRWEEAEVRLQKIQTKAQEDDRLLETLNACGIISLLFVDRSGVVKKTLGFRAEDNQPAQGRPASDVLGFGTEEFRRVCEEVFSSNNFHEVIEQLPSELNGPQGRWLKVRYAPVRGSDETLEWLMISVEDMSHARASNEDHDMLLTEKAVYRGLLRHPIAVPSLVASLARTAEGAKKVVQGECTADEISACLQHVARFADIAVTIGVPHIARRASILLEEMREFASAPQAVARAVIPAIRAEVDALNSHTLELFQVTSQELARQGSHWVSIPRLNLENFSRRLAKIPALNPVRTTFDQSFLSVATNDFEELLESYAVARSERSQKPADIDVKVTNVTIPETETTRLLETVFQLIDLSLDESIEDKEERAEIGKIERARLTLELSLLKAPVGAPSQLSLRLEDDGRGMNNEDSASAAFTKFEAVVARIGGSMESVPSPGAGLKLVVLFPMGSSE